MAYMELTYLVCICIPVFLFLADPNASSPSNMVSTCIYTCMHMNVYDICVCIYVYICTYACMYVCMYVYKSHERDLLPRVHTIRERLLSLIL